MKESVVLRKISDLAAAYGATIVYFKYYKKIFGNVVVRLEFNRQIYEFITDRGEIYCNKILICDNSYHAAGSDDRINKLLEVIASIISSV